MFYIALFDIQGIEYLILRLDRSSKSSLYKLGSDIETETFIFGENNSFIISLVLDWALEEFSIIVLDFDKLRLVSPF